MSPIRSIESSDNESKYKNLELSELAKLMEENSFMSCKCVGTLYNYFIDNTPLITFVNVYCKNCNYQNALPFHFLNVHETNIASKLYLLDESNEFLKNFPHIQEMKLYLYKQNFNVDWLFEARPSGLTSFISTNKSITSFYYDCPRCFWMKKELVKLTYIYRFPFKIADKNNFKIGPCLIENELALECFNQIDPLEFCCSNEKATLITDMIFNMLGKNMSFEIEAFKQDCANISMKEKIIYIIKSFSFL